MYAQKHFKFFSTKQCILFNVSVQYKLTRLPLLILL